MDTNLDGLNGGVIKHCVTRAHITSITFENIELFVHFRRFQKEKSLFVPLSSTKAREDSDFAKTVSALSHDDVIIALTSFRRRASIRNVLFVRIRPVPRTAPFAALVCSCCGLTRCTAVRKAGGNPRWRKAAGGGGDVPLDSRRIEAVDTVGFVGIFHPGSDRRAHGTAEVPCRTGDSRLQGAGRI